MRRCCIRGVPNIARQRKARLGEDFLGGMKESPRCIIANDWATSKQRPSSP
jgi:hypothetical protein